MTIVYNHTNLCTSYMNSDIINNLIYVMSISSRNNNYHSISNYALLFHSSNYRLSRNYLTIIYISLLNSIYWKGSPLNKSGSITHLTIYYNRHYTYKFINVPGQWSHVDQEQTQRHRKVEKNKN
jgi:hypothetical protein